ncbi:MAG: DUF4920 domain-containing protein [Bacteroidetes bacterium]|nr:DUF4920 domain-containing protein [Bacteroidota bacterium]
MRKVWMWMLLAQTAISPLLAQEPAPATKGVSYGAGVSKEGEAVLVAKLEQQLTEDRFSGKARGKVVEVCLEKGCWMKLAQADGKTLMVRFKDYGFFMPKNIVGKEVLLEGDASYRQMSVDMQRHYAKDAGKSEEEIQRIREPKRDLQFVAKGVVVL